MRKWVFLSFVLALAACSSPPEPTRCDPSAERRPINAGKSVFPEPTQETPSTEGEGAERESDEDRQTPRRLAPQMTDASAGGCAYGGA